MKSYLEFLDFPIFKYDQKVECRINVYLKKLESLDSFMKYFNRPLVDQLLSSDNVIWINVKKTKRLLQDKGCFNNFEIAGEAVKD